MAAPTSYLDIISLETAKLYLKIDDLQTVTDAEITAMINSALSYVEKSTNIIMYARDRNYYGDYKADVYDWPINSIDIPERTTYTYSTFLTTDGVISLNVGVTDVEQIPSELIDSALQIIAFWFYNSETKNSENSIPDFMVNNLDKNRRFV